MAPPRNPWPDVAAIVALVLVGSIVVAATLFAGRTPTSPVGPAGVAAPVPATGNPVRATPGPSNRMEFVSDDGDGVLVVTAARWSSTGQRPPTYGTYLHVQVQLICTAGRLSYGPDSFSAFDATGELFEVLERERSGTPLGYGSLTAGQSVRGTISFDLPRGDVTLLLSDSASQSVTALRIPD